MWTSYSALWDLILLFAKFEACTFGFLPCKFYFGLISQPKVSGWLKTKLHTICGNFTANLMAGMNFWMIKLPVWVPLQVCVKMSYLVEYIWIPLRPLTYSTFLMFVEYSPLSELNHWYSKSIIIVVYSPCKIINSL